MTTSDTSSDLSSSSTIERDTNDIQRETIKIEKWLSKRSENDLLFLLSSTSGQLVTIYDQFGSITHPIRISMDGKYLIIGERSILLDKKTLDISRGIATKTTNNYNDNNTHTNTNNNNNNILSVMTDKQFENYICNALSSTNQYREFDFEEINDRYTRRHMIASNLENSANNYENLSNKNCITLHIIGDDQYENNSDIVLEFVDVRQRYLWAKGISKLISSKKKKPHYRQKAIAYILKKYANTVNDHALMTIKHTSDEIENQRQEYFEKRKQYAPLISKHIYIKSFEKKSNRSNLLDDQITMDLMPIEKSSNHILHCVDQWKLFWNSLFDPQSKQIRKLPQKYAALYHRRSRRNGRQILSDTTRNK